MKKISLSLLAIAFALMWSGCGQSGDPLASGSNPMGPEGFAPLAKKGGNPGPPDGGGGGGKDKGSATALVAISGGMATEVEQTFSVAKDNKRMLQLDTPGGFPVSLRFDFAATQAGTACQADPADDLREMLVDPAGQYALRRHVTIRVDVSDLKQEGDVSTTGSDGHFIEVWTDPALDGGSYLWVPEGPRGPNSGPVTVELVRNFIDVDGKRVRLFRFSSNQVQVHTGTGESLRILRCDNFDPPIEVSVRTAP